MCQPSASSAIDPDTTPATISPTIITAVTAITVRVRRWCSACSRPRKSCSCCQRSIGALVPAGAGVSGPVAATLLRLGDLGRAPARPA
jgi:hypothetical protein